MKLFLIITGAIVCAFLVMVVGCGALVSANVDDTSIAATPSGSSGADVTEVPDAPGSPTVHQKINRMTSCAKLQQVFNGSLAKAEAADPLSAEVTAFMSYADAANSRMQAVGCYG